LADTADLFKISTLVKGGKEILRSLYNSLEETDRDSLGGLEQASMFAICQCQNQWFREL